MPPKRKAVTITSTSIVPLSPPAKRSATPVNSVLSGSTISSGITLNGLTSNGIPSSGITSNGLTPNGLTPNAAPDNNRPIIDGTPDAEKYGIVQREFYPPEMSNSRCAQYNLNQIPRPLAVLESTIASTAAQRSQVPVGDAVVHWFKRDLRLRDNRALSLASAKAREAGVPLICMFIVSPQDYQAHLTSAVRVDFELRTLEVLKEDLGQLDIPLFVETVEKRRTGPEYMIGLWEKWRVKHVFCGIEYEVDELRREDKLLRMCLERGISFTAVHDDVVVAPGALMTGQGRQYAVYTPWYRSWVAHIHSHPGILDEFDSPSRNPYGAREKFKGIFEKPIPSAPSNKTLTEEEKTRFRSMWPAGEHEAHERLQKFLTEKIGKYKDMRNFPATNNTAVLSVHFSSGTLAARTAVRSARDMNSTKNLDGGNPGIMCWISEVAWRDFYKHVLAHWPYVW